MARAKMAITLERSILEQLDRLIGAHIFRNRSQTIQAALEEKLSRLERRRLTLECSKPDPIFEKAMAEEGLTKFSRWLWCSFYHIVN